MTSEPIQPESDPSDPTSLPPLFSTPPARPGRVRGGFSMRPVGDEPPAPVPLDVVRRRHAATPGAGATGASVSDHENLDWGLVAAFRTLVATRLAAAMGDDWRSRASEPSETATSGRVPMDRAAQEQEGWRAIDDLLTEHTADAVATAFQAVQAVGLPEARIILSQAVIYLATSPKSNSAYLAINKAQELVHQQGNQPVPLHLRNAPTQLMKKLDYGKAYQYAHDFPQNFVEQEYLPEKLSGTKLFEPAENPVEEKTRGWLRGLWKKKYGY